MKLEKRVQIAVPVRVTVPGTGKPQVQMACTYDISAKGARLTGVSGVKREEILQVQRGMEKALFKVMWVGAAGTSFQNQIGVMCMEGDAKIWNVKLEELEEQYEPMVPELPGKGSAATDRLVSFASGSTKAHIFPENSSAAIEGELVRLALGSCDIKSAEKLGAQLAVQVLIVGGGFDLRLRGFVQRTDLPAIIKIGLNEIRRGDRRTMNFLLEQPA